MPRPSRSASLPAAARGLPDRRRRVSEPLGVRPRLQREAARRRAVRARRPGVGTRPAVVRLVARRQSRIAFNRNEGGFGRSLRRRRRHRRGRGGREGRARRRSRGRAIASRRSAVAARTPTEIVVYDAKWQRARVARGAVGGFESAGLVEPDLVEWAGDDGGTVHGRLYRPTTSATGADPPPLICSVHGGPSSQSRVVFNARWAFWIDRGWAVLVPDHRGSHGARPRVLAGDARSVGRSRHV